MLILAFPSMGKTPLSLKSGKYLDLDFGHFRESLNVSKENESSLYDSFIRLVRLYEDSGFVVLSNEPALLGRVPVAKVFVPRNYSRAAQKLNVSETQIAEWVADWETKARKFNIPVIKLSVGLDHYLLSKGRTKKGGERDAESGNNTHRKRGNK